MNYNGWTNYATWRVHLEMFDGTAASDVTGRALPATSELQNTLREIAEEMIESTAEGLARDYAFAFLSDVNWWEIADHMIETETEEN